MFRALGGRRYRISPITLVLFVAACSGTGQNTFAGQVVLDSNLVYEGIPVPVMGITERLKLQNQGPVPTYPILMLDTGMKWYFFAGRRVVDHNNDAMLSRYESFEIKHRTSGRSLTPTSIGRYSNIEQFNEFGVRTVTLATDRGDVPIVQGITKLTPSHVTVKGLTHTWEHGIATTSIPPPILDSILKEIIDEQDPLQRLAVAKFYLQSGLYLESERELRLMIEDFPDHKDRIGQMFNQLQELIASRFLGELQRRMNAGQHQLVLAKAREFPAAQLSAAVQERVDQIIQDELALIEKRQTALLLLSEFHAELDDAKLIQATASMRSRLRDRLDLEGVQRLEPFLNLAEAENLSAEKKLGLAYSGWVLGSNNAVDDLPEAIRMWDARFLIQEYLNAEHQNARTQLVSSLEQIEGISAERVQMLLQNLPPDPRAQPVPPGVAHTITVTPEDAAVPVSYSVLLPHEYSPHHRYPVVLALHPGQGDAETELKWWGGTAEEPGQSQRRGYIVLAPHYLDEGERDYDYDVARHAVVLESLRDARRRFSIDSDRVFLSGHGVGGDAALDIGMSHPHEFAGLIPICGRADMYCRWYWSNTQDLPMYLVGGELDGDWFEHNAQLGQVNRMLKLGYDITYAVYRGRGRESFYEEIHQLFDWMACYQRQRFPKELSAQTVRPTDNQFHWIEIQGLPPAVTRSGVLTGDHRIKTSPMKLSGRVTPGNTISVQSGAQKTTLWLSPELVDYDRRVSVRIKGRQRFNDFPRPSIAEMLEDFARRHDREKQFWTKLSF